MLLVPMLIIARNFKNALIQQKRVGKGNIPLLIWKEVMLTLVAVPNLHPPSFNGRSTLELLVTYRNVE